MVQFKAAKDKDIAEYIEFEKHFSFRPYEYTPQRVTEVKLYAGPESSLLDVSARGVSAKLMTWLAINSPIVLPFITESKTGVMS